jgi:16S rRNA (adenine1518-N6/adenine1519-N6)-dimethyltransferase
VLCRLYADVYDEGDVAAGSFHPVPRVVSKIVVVEPHERYGREVRAIAVLLARDAFGARRKTLRNALKSGRTAGRFGFRAVMDALNAAGIDPGLRGEKLSIEDYAAVAGHLDNHPGNEV